MSASTADVLARDRKLVELLDMYFAERQAGRTPNRDALLAAHPELAEELAASFDTLEFMFGCRVVDFAAVNGLEAFTERALGDYRLLREVGRGGMGVVYEAEQISLARRVALKVLPFAAMLDPRRLQRFKNEAQAAAALDHPNIVEVHGVGCERGVHFYVMRFVEGITLAELIQAKRSSSVSATQRTVLGKESKLEDGSLPAEPPHETQIAQLTTATSPQLQAAISTLIASAPKEQYCRVAELGIQAAEALEHAHQLGVVHRDVKPSNLMIDAAGKLWVTDFGLAHVDSNATLTMPGDVLGTLRYMSPEQAAGRPTMIDHRTDIYSLGATLYELATERPVVQAQERAAILREIAETDPAPPRKLTPAMSADFETILLKCLAKEPSARYDTAQALADDLRRFLEQKPVVAKAPGAMLKVKKWAQRHKNAAGAAAAAAFVSILCLVFSTLAVSAAWLNEREATRAARSERNEQVYRSYVADMQLGSREMEIGALSVATNCLENHRPSPGEKDLRNWEWYFLNSECHEESAVLSHTAAVNSVEYSPDGTLLATGGLDWKVRIWNADSRLLTAELPGCQAPVTSMSWSPNGKRLAACSGDGTVIVWNIESAQIERSTQPKGATAGYAVDWSPNGQQLAAAIEINGVQGAVVIYDMNSNAEQEVKVDGAISNVSWTGDHRLIYSIGGAQGAMRKAIVYDLDAHQPIAETPVYESLVLDVSPDGSRVALGGESRNWRIYDVATLKMTHEFDCDTMTAIRWNPLSTQIACGEVDGRIRLWDIESGRVTRTLAAHQMQVSRLAWSKNGQQLASASYDGSVKLWDVGQEHVDRRLPFGPEFDVDGAGRQLAAVSRGDICVFDLESGTLTSRLEAAVGGWPYTIAWRPDSRYIAAAFHTDDENDPDGVVLDVAAQRIVQRIPGGRFVAWSPDGAKLAISTRRNNVAPIVSRKSEQSHDIVVVEFLTGREIARLPGKPWQCSLAWSPDGKDLAAINTEMQVQVWDTTTWRRKWVLELYPEEPQLVSWSITDAVNWSPDGTRLAAVSSLGRLTVWSIPECKEIQRIHASSSALGSVVWSPDGRRLATLSQDFRVWDSQTGELLLSRRMPGCGLDWSRDGKRILLGGEGGQSRCLDASIGYARER